MEILKYLIELTASFYHQQQTTVQTAGCNSERFFIGQGVRQGYILSPRLLKIYIEFIMGQDLEGLDKVEGAGISTAGYLLNNLRYADDTPTEPMQQILGSLKTVSEENGLFLNEMKIKCMYIDMANKNWMQEDIIINGETVEAVDELDYLGSYIKETVPKKLEKDLGWLTHLWPPLGKCGEMVAS